MLVDLAVEYCSPTCLFTHDVVHETSARELTEDLLGALNYKPRTLEDYDQHFADFDEATGHSVYSISQFQKAVAARAKCLLLVGLGTFHENTLALYMSHHKRKCML